MQQKTFQKALHEESEEFEIAVNGPSLLTVTGGYVTLLEEQGE